MSILMASLLSNNGEGRGGRMGVVDICYQSRHMTGNWFTNHLNISDIESYID